MPEKTKLTKEDYQKRVEDFRREADKRISETYIPLGEPVWIEEDGQMYPNTASRTSDLLKLK